MIVCKQVDYPFIESAVRNLDVLPAQVLIEVTVAEVVLNDALSHGVSWFLQGGHHGLNLGVTNPSQANGLTFTYGIPDANVAIQALESVSTVEIMAAPTLTVLDNQTATIKVGDQIPFLLTTAQSPAAAAAPIVSNIGMKDTGILLKVTPRVNAGGSVLLDIDQQDNDPIMTTTSKIDSPTIHQREINSSIEVQSGSEIVLGGLILRKTEHNHSGLPILNNVPVLGPLLATTASDSDARTELLVMLRPTILANQTEVAAVTQEIKRRMHDSLVPQP